MNAISPARRERRARPHRPRLARRRPRPHARRRPAATLAAERGDVLVTLMTAGLVVALWAVAGPALTQVFLDAIAKVTGAI